MYSISIDISQESNFTNEDWSEMNKLYNLTAISFEGYNGGNIDFSKFKDFSITDISFNTFNGETLSLNVFKDCTCISINGYKAGKIDVSKLDNIESIRISKEINDTYTELNDEIIIGDSFSYKDYSSSSVYSYICAYKVKKQYEIYQNEEMSLSGNNFISDDSNIIEIEQRSPDTYLNAKNAGKTKVSFADDFNNELETEIIVKEIPTCTSNYDQELINSGITTEFVTNYGEGEVLTSDGEVYSCSLGEWNLMKSNVSDFAYHIGKLGYYLEITKERK